MRKDKGNVFITVMEGVGSDRYHSCHICGGKHDAPSFVVRAFDVAGASAAVMINNEYRVIDPSVPMMVQKRPIGGKEIRAHHLFRNVEPDTKQLKRIIERAAHGKNHTYYEDLAEAIREVMEVDQL